MARSILSPDREVIIEWSLPAARLRRIERILPHRYPFLLVDRIIEFEPDKRIVGRQERVDQRAATCRARRAAGRRCRQPF